MILIIGSGTAGLACALAALDAGADVELVAQEHLSAAEEQCANGNSALAQGGIAAAIGTRDSPEQHAADTLHAGAGLVDEAAADELAKLGAREVTQLIEAGFSIDREPNGRPAFGLEGAHSIPRIVHAGGDRSGAALHEFLLSRITGAAKTGRIQLSEGRTAVELLQDGGAVTGAILREHGAEGTLHTRSADAVVLATGGYAGLFSATSNTRSATGDGLMLAARVGALLADLEFVQFHPTALVESDHQSFLVSEAVRGAGATLLDNNGRQFMLERHPAAELAPRDVVARGMHGVMREQGESSVLLDATAIERQGGPGTLARRFPRISEATSAAGFDWAREPVPVAPAAHYAMGGVATDLDGRSNVPGLFAVGEAASTGVHGANRLASNSLLECLVFGAAAGRAAAKFEGAWEHRGSAMQTLARDAFDIDVNPGRARVRTVGTAAHPDPVRTAFDTGLGIERDRAGLRDAAETFAAYAQDSRAQLGYLMTALANARTESRGAHTRTDFPSIDAALERRQAVRMIVTSRSAPRTSGTEQGLLSAEGERSIHADHAIR